LITDYTSLQSAAVEYLARDQDTTLIARIPTFIQLFEAKMNRDLFVRQMEARATTTIDTTTTPIEAVLLWSIGKERRVQGGFPGAGIIQKQIAEGAPRKRVGLLPEGKAIAREGSEIALGGKVIGKITSGGFAPSLGRAVAMGYVERAQSANGTKVELVVRGKPVPAEIVPMPFVKHAYYRG